VFCRGVSHDFCRLACLDKSTVVDDHKLRCQAPSFRDIVRNQDNGRRLSREQLEEASVNISSSQRIDTGERFVEKQNLGPKKHGPTDAYALLLSAGELIGVTKLELRR
jgi:hypothetical protein